MAVFPTDQWLQELNEKLNTDQQYAHIARNWEGDLRVIIEPSGSLKEELWAYFDLWHGKCRQAFFEGRETAINPALVLRGKYEDVGKIVLGELDVMQALLTRRLSVKANMGLLMKNVPVVLDFVRCVREVTDGIT
jgi:putative sterol carrier protein